MPNLKRRKRIGIVGGGILGSSIAYHLARRGVEVILFEKTRPAAEATEKSFAWINATFGKPTGHYHVLNRYGTESWLHLDRTLEGRFDLQWNGGIFWRSGSDQAAELTRQVANHQALGYPSRLIDATELGHIEKNIVPGEILAAAYSEHEGSVDPVHATQILLDAAHSFGAAIHYPVEVISLETDSGQLEGVRTSAGDFHLDVLVIAAGADTPVLAAMAGLQVPLKKSSGMLAFTKPTARLIERVLHPNDISMIQQADGTVVIGSGFAHVQDPSPEHGMKLIKKASQYLPALERVELEKTTLGWRPLPIDDLPIVGFDPSAPDVYLAVMHSGITLGPLMGELAALEIVDAVEVEILTPYRLSRFQN